MVPVVRYLWCAWKQGSRHGPISQWSRELYDLTLMTTRYLSDIFVFLYASLEWLSTIFGNRSDQRSDAISNLRLRTNISARSDPNDPPASSPPAFCFLAPPGTARIKRNHKLKPLNTSDWGLWKSLVLVSIDLCCEAPSTSSFLHSFRTIMARHGNG